MLGVAHFKLRVALQIQNVLSRSEVEPDVPREPLVDVSPQWNNGRGMDLSRSLLIMALAVVATATTSSAQGAPQLETIPQTLARVGESLTDRPSIPSGIADMALVLRETELIVRGTIGSPTKAYLSSDARSIHTDYPLVKPIVLYDSRVQSSRTPGREAKVTVTILGGSIHTGGLTFTSIPEALSELPVGTEGLFLLKRIDDKYQPVGRFFGAVEISAGQIKRPFTRKQAFADEYRGASAAATAQSWVAAVAKQRKTQKP